MKVVKSVRKTMAQHHLALDRHL